MTPILYSDKEEREARAINVGSTYNTPEPEAKQSDDDCEFEDDDEPTNKKVKPRANSRAKSSVNQRELAKRKADNRRRLLKVMEKTRVEQMKKDMYKKSNETVTRVGRSHM